MIYIFLQLRPPAAASPFHHYVVPPPPSAGVGKFMEEKGTASLHPLPTPVSGVGGERSEPEGVSCLRQLKSKRGCEKMIYIFSQPPFDFVQMRIMLPAARRRQ